ncbi:MAG: M48 family metalloprotease [Bacteroidales bacterium]|nr:M48 family metalloprotease [Bacteroidales bacterium]
MFTTFIWIFISLMLFGFFVERVLDLLNAKYFDRPIPTIIAAYFSADFQTKNLDYKKQKQQFSLINSSISFLATLFFWWWGGFYFLMEIAEGMVASEILQTLIFFGFLGALSSILSLPFSYYFNFVLEEKFGFNKMTIKTFLLDLLKSSLLAIILGGGLISLVVWVYTSIPDHFWWIVWLLMSIVMVFLSAFYAQLIVPLFNKQSELEEGELKSAIQLFADKADFSLDNIYIMDGSKRSSKANAYFTGLGRQKRIVLYDTLVNDLETNEIVAVLAHEIGHYKHRHTFINISLGIVQTGIMLFILSLFIAPKSDIALLLNQVVAMNPELSNTHFYLGIIGFGIIYSPISMVLELLMNMLSRKFEYQADGFAAKLGLGKELKEALIKLSKNSLNNLTPHPAYVFMHYSHPPIVKRFEALS